MLWNYAMTDPEEKGSFLISEQRVLLAGVYS
jgi:hypothetical protein